MARKKTVPPLLCSYKGPECRHEKGKPKPNGGMLGLLVPDLCPSVHEIIWAFKGTPVTVPSTKSILSNSKFKSNYETLL